MLFKKDNYKYHGESIYISFSSHKYINQKKAF